jgi:hypothetical protein
MFAKGLPMKLGIGRIGCVFSVPGTAILGLFDSFITSLGELED